MPAKMPAKFALTKAKQSNTRKKVLKGKPLQYNAAVQERFTKSLKALVVQMCAQTKKEVMRMYQTHSTDHAMDASIASQGRILVNDLNRRFAKLFARKALELAGNMINGSASASQSALHASLEDLSGGLSIKTSTISARLKELMAASSVESVALIKTIQQQYHAGVQQAVMRSISAPDGGLKYLSDYFEEQQGKTARKAELMALDQTRKVYSQINTERMKGVGIKKFEWVHSGGGQHPRTQHQDWDGQYFSFDNPPVDDDFGPVMPGVAINCRCIAAPVFEFEEEGNE